MYFKSILSTKDGTDYTKNKNVICNTVVLHIGND